jgi:hypothetical protein
LYQGGPAANAKTELQPRFGSNSSPSPQRFVEFRKSHRGELEKFLEIVWVLEFVPDNKPRSGNPVSCTGSNNLSTKNSNLKTYQNCRNFTTSYNLILVIIKSMTHILQPRNDELSLGWYYILDVPAFELNGSIFNFSTRVVLTTLQRCCKLPRKLHWYTIISTPNIWI